MMLSAVKMCERWTGAGGRTWANSSDRKAGGVPGQQQGSRSHPARAAPAAGAQGGVGGGCWDPTGCQAPSRLPAHPGVFAPRFEGVKTARKRVARVHPGSSRAPPSGGQLCALPWAASSATSLRLTTVVPQ